MDYSGGHSMGYCWSTMPDFRYKSFISYSHRDEPWGKWVQRALESYRVPRRLVGGKGRFGPVPARIAPVFRDREDLSSAADLSSSVMQELLASETLVVICSPAAAASKWVRDSLFPRTGARRQDPCPHRRRRSPVKRSGTGVFSRGPGRGRRRDGVRAPGCRCPQVGGRKSHGSPQAGGRNPGNSPG